MMDNVTLPAGAKLTNTAVVDLGASYIDNNQNTCYMSGVVVSGGSSPNWGVQLRNYNANITAVDCVFSGAKTYSRFGAIGVSSGSLALTSCTFAGNSTINGGVTCLYANNAAHTILSSCTMSADNVGGYDAPCVYYDGASTDNTIKDCNFGASQQIKVNTNATVTLVGNNTIDSVVGSGSVTISSGASINLTSSIAPGGGITVETGGCTVNGNVIPAGTYTSIDSNGSATV
jgi:hypothetical protein